MGLTSNAKRLYNDAMLTYIAANPVERKKLIDDVEQKLRQHYSAIQSIGMGYAADYVAAGRQFVRQAYKYEQRLKTIANTST